MQSEMRPLGEFVTLVSGNTPSKGNPAYWGGGTPWVSAKDMGDFWIEDAEDHLTDAGVAVASRLMQPGAVLLLARGMTLHKRVPICRVARATTFNQDVKAVLPKTGLLPRFLPYLLVGNHDRLHERVDSAGHGTGRLNTDALLSIPVLVPSSAEQEAIADVGEAIDERLRLLRQTNASLEAIAQALFKSWFIAFDPVRAKAEGREPEGMDAATAALFPAEFEESALGLIPKGWRVGTVEDLLVLQRGFDLPASQRTDGSITVFAASGPHGTHSMPMAQGPGVLTGRSGVIGRVFFAHEDYWPLNTALWVKQFKAATPTYAFQYLQTMDLARLNAGSAVPTLNRNHVHAQPAVIPPGGLVSAYEAVAVQLLERNRANSEHARRLEALRDTLLPRLISGKLRVPHLPSTLQASA